MRSLTRLLSGLALAALAACVYPPAGALFVQVGPPPIREEVIGVAPGADYVWVAGYWAWGGSDYYWVPGSWVVRPYPYAVWEPGRWRGNRRGWYWAPGHWRR